MIFFFLSILVVVVVVVLVLVDVVRFFFFLLEKFNVEFCRCCFVCRKRDKRGRARERGQAFFFWYCLSMLEAFVPPVSSESK